MTTFAQYHVLVGYPPSNLNRDDSGRPKTAVVGGAQRIRISSQSLKRAWRISDVFAQSLEGHLGARTRKIGARVKEQLEAAGTDGKVVEKVVKAIEALFKDGDKKNPVVFLGAAELNKVDDVVAEVKSTGKAPKDEVIAGILTKDHGSADIAMFGRMMASQQAFTSEAAVEVAHAFTVHKSEVEDDYYTAVDDLARREDGDAASGFLDAQYFAAGVYYLYVCVNEDLLLANLGGDAETAAVARKALVEAMISVGPSGKRASYASRARTSYVLAERGTKLPRSLATAFLSPIRGTNVLKDSVLALNEAVRKMDRAYGKLADARYVFDVEEEQGDLEGLLSFAAGEG